LWVFAPSVTQKPRLSGLLWQFAGKKIVLQAIFQNFMREAQQTARVFGLRSTRQILAILSASSYRTGLLNPIPIKEVYRAWKILSSQVTAAFLPGEDASPAGTIRQFAGKAAQIAEFPYRNPPDKALSFSMNDALYALHIEAVPKLQFWNGNL
jgi:hypothetical protein